MEFGSHMRFTNPDGSEGSLNKAYKDEPNSRRCVSLIAKDGSHVLTFEGTYTLPEFALLVVCNPDYRPMTPGEFRRYSEQGLLW